MAPQKSNKASVGKSKLDAPSEVVTESSSTADSEQTEAAAAASFSADTKAAAVTRSRRTDLKVTRELITRRPTAAAAAESNYSVHFSD